MFRWKKDDRIIGIPGMAVYSGERATIESTSISHYGFGYFVIFDKWAPFVEYWDQPDLEGKFVDELPRSAQTSNTTTNELTTEEKIEAWAAGFWPKPDFRPKVGSAEKECDHQFESYYGLTENYKYCTKCDHKVGLK